MKSRLGMLYTSVYCVQDFPVLLNYILWNCLHARDVQGGSLSALIKRAREYDEILNEFEVAEWLIHITLALQHLHSKYEYVSNCSLCHC